MTSIYQLKPQFQRSLRPIVGRLAGGGVTANQVTIAAMVLSAAGGAAVALWPQNAAILLVLPCVLPLRMALNAIDGMLARDHGQTSRLGAILNELGDVVSDSVLYLPLALAWPGQAWLVVAVVMTAVIAEMTGVIAVQIGASRRYDGPMGKSDRAAVLGLVCLAGGVGLPLDPWIGWVLGLTAVLGVATIVNRARAALAETTDRRLERP